MITVREFKEISKNPDGKLTEFHAALYPKEYEMLQQFCRKHGLSRSSAVRYFCTLGMQAHRERSRLKKKYGKEAEERMLRRGLIAGFEQLLEADA